MSTSSDTAAFCEDLFLSRSVLAKALPVNWLSFLPVRDRFDVSLLAGIDMRCCIEGGSLMVLLVTAGRLIGRLAAAGATVAFASLDADVYSAVETAEVAAEV